MRIAILVGGLPPLYNGGTEIATVKIAEAAARAGHEVHVIAADGTRKGTESYRALEYGFRIHRVPTIPPHYLHGFFCVPGALRVILSIKPDLVHAQALYTTPAALLAKKLAGIPFLFSERGGINQDWTLKGFTYRMVMRNADRVVAQTESQKALLLSYVNRTVEVIPNGVDTERFGKVGQAEARAMLRLPDIRRIALFVGRCRVEKNPGVFVDAAKLDSQTLYVLLGDGPLLDEMKARVNGAGNVMFAGAVDNKDIPTWMAAADVLVNTSHFEGFPVAVLEGMAAGLPIVAPDYAGLREIGFEGYLMMGRMVNGRSPGR